MATGCHDGLARVWTRHGRLLTALRHQDDVTAVAWSPDDGHLLVGAIGDEARVWVVDPALVLRNQWLSTPLCLTADEREQLLGESQAAAEAGLGECMDMQRCLAGPAGELVGERYTRCHAEYQAARAARLAAADR